MATGARYVFATRVMSLWAPIFAIPLFAATACTPESIFDDLASAPDDADAEDEDDGGSEALTPRFLDPEGGTMSITADHRETISLRVQSVNPGTTLLLIDGQNIGPLPQGQREGSFSDGQLHLHFAGALTEGVHSLTLYNPGLAEGKYSPPIAIEVRPSADLLPSLELADTVLAQASELRQDGSGASEVLSWVDADGQLNWIRGDESGSWSGEELMSFSPNDYEFREGGWARISVAPEGDGWRAAWLAGRSARELHYAELAAEGDSLQVEREGSIDASALTFLGGEALSLAAPQLGPGFLLLGFDAPRDSEAQTPGDRGLLFSRWLRGSSPEPAQRVGHHPNANLSAPHPLIELRPSTPPPLEFGVAVDDTWIRRISSEPSLGLVNFPEAVLKFTEPLPLSTRDFATVAGALGSRSTLVAAGADSLVNLEAVYAERGESQPLSGAALPDQSPSGPMAASCWQGRSVFALPYGDEAVRLVISDGARAHSFETSITCDQIALARPTLAPDAAQSPTLGVACLHGGELRLGELSVAP